MQRTLPKVEPPVVKLTRLKRGEPARLALDLGLTTGYAVAGFNRIMHGTWKLQEKPKRPNGERFLTLFRALDRLLKTYADRGDPIREIHYEHVLHHVSLSQCQQYGGHLAIVQAIGALHNIPLKGWPPSTIKRLSTGNGAAQKCDMIMACQLLGFRPRDDNEADAIMLLGLAREQDPPPRNKKKPKARRVQAEPQRSATV